MAYVPRLSSATPTRMEGNPYWYSSLNGYYARGYGLPNCTCYAYGRAIELNGGQIVPGLAPRGNAGQWYNNSDVSLRAGTDAWNVQLGDILVWYSPSGTYAGHVAVVEVIDRTASRPYIKISQSGYVKRPLSKAPTAYKTYFWTQVMHMDTGFVEGWQLTARNYRLRGILRFLSNPGTPSYPIPTSWVSKAYIYDMNEEDRQNNAILTYVYLTQKGWTLEAIAGFLGNVQTESNISPGCWGLGGANAFGLVMWTPSSNYIPWADYYGYARDDGNAQLDFIDMGVYCFHGDPLDLRNTWTPYNHGINMTYAEFKASHKTPEELAYVFLWGYERAAGDGMIATRRKNARHWYEFLQGVDVGSIGPIINGPPGSLIDEKMKVTMYGRKRPTIYVTRR